MEEENFEPDEAVDLTKQQADHLEGIRTSIQVLQNNVNALINQVVDESDVDVGDEDIVTYQNGQILIQFAEEKNDDSEHS